MINKRNFYKSKIKFKEKILVKIVNCHLKKKS